jgi:hypothetical protein
MPHEGMQDWGVAFAELLRYPAAESLSQPVHRQAHACPLGNQDNAVRHTVASERTPAIPGSKRKDFIVIVWQRFQRFA